MPKLRTKTMFKKRFRLTGSGKLMRQVAGGAKLRAKKNAKTRRRYANMQQVAHSDEKIIKKALGV